MSEQEIIDELQKSWIWIPNWRDGSDVNTAARLVSFTRNLRLDKVPSQANIKCSADTRYKLIINGRRVTVGPSRSSPERWLYDTIDIAPFLAQGENTLTFIVIRYFLTTRAGMPFVRTPFPGLTVVGRIGETNVGTLDVESWLATADDSVTYPTGLIDDVFLHINERVGILDDSPGVLPTLYGFRLTNGELSPWRLSPRIIPLPELTHVGVSAARCIHSNVPLPSWQAFFESNQPVTVSCDSTHVIDLRADVHSTAFTRWEFRSSHQAILKLKITYSEGYELEPRRYPWLRTKADRLDADKGQLLGPHDEVTVQVTPEGAVYEPFWFRTFRVMRVEIRCEKSDIEFISFSATQTNYPLNVKARWHETEDPQSKDIFDISIRTMRNCMFDAYSDCPFYEQLSYSGDTRSVGLFHYLISGDDRLIRQTILSFAGSITPEGLTQSRYPSQAPQIIPGFSLYWIMTICDHFLYFGDTSFVKPLIPLIDGVFEFFDRHIDDLGLVSGLSTDVWQYVDWVHGWHETAEHPDKGVPTAGRKTNRHTYISMLYACVLQQASALLTQVGRSGNAVEYETRSKSVVLALKKHCFDQKLGIFTDSTSDVLPDTPTPYSQHCQVFAVLCGAVDGEESAQLLRKAFSPDSNLGKCSYVMMFYAFRAFAKAGIYNEMYPEAWNPWRGMIAKNLTTWEEDDVRQRSDCHAWGSVPIYEYLTEVAGIQPSAAGCSEIIFSPRVSLSSSIEAVVALGKDNTAKVSWKRVEGERSVKVALRLDKAVKVTSNVSGKPKDHGVISELVIEYQI